MEAWEKMMINGERSLAWTSLVVNGSSLLVSWMQGEEEKERENSMEEKEMRWTQMKLELGFIYFSES